MICMICTCLPGWDLYDLPVDIIIHNFSVSAEKDLDDLDHYLSEVWNTPIVPKLRST